MGQEISVLRSSHFLHFSCYSACGPSWTQPIVHVSYILFTPPFRQAQPWQGPDSWLPRVFSDVAVLSDYGS